MKFSYSYRDKANTRVDAVIDARDREAAYKTLHAQGVKPFVLEPAPGLLNHLFGRGKRWMAIGVLGVLLVALAVALVEADRRAARARSEAQIAQHQSPRHQIYGDPALMEELERTDFAAVFTHPGERILARYAQPGNLPKSVFDAPTSPFGRARSPSAPDSSPAGRAASMRPPSSPSAPDVLHPLAACLTNEIAFAATDAREVTELKQIVNWMKGELSRYLANGIGTPERYQRRLRDRQIREAQLYVTAKHDLEKETDPAKFERINASLRAVGLKTIPLPSPSPTPTSEFE